jgi:hypothetical protein
MSEFEINIEERTALGIWATNLQDSQCHPKTATADLSSANTMEHMSA